MSRDYSWPHSWPPGTSDPGLGPDYDEEAALREGELARDDRESFIEWSLRALDIFEAERQERLDRCIRARIHEELARRTQ